MCKFAKEVYDPMCYRQYVAHVVFMDDQYDVVCNINEEGTADLVPVNQRGKVNDRGKTFEHYDIRKRPTNRMIRETLRIDRNEPCTISFERI